MPTSFRTTLRATLAAVAASLSLSALPAGNVAVDPVGPGLEIEYCLFDGGTKLSVLGMFRLPDGERFWHSVTLDVPDPGVWLDRTLSDVLIAYPSLPDRAESEILALYNLVAPGSAA